jgi:hypothetical protein
MVSERGQPWQSRITKAFFSPVDWAEPLLYYWNGGYTQTRFDQINLFDPDGDGTPFGSIGSHTYHGWFIGGGTEIALSGLFGLPLPSGLFWRSEYRAPASAAPTYPCWIRQVFS